MSAVLAAKSVVFGLLQNWDWPTRTPTISWSAPTKGEDTNTWSGEHIYLATSEVEVPLDTMYMGRGWREEFDIPVVIDVYQDGDDEQACEARADVLYDEVVWLFNQARSTGLEGTVTQLSGWTSSRAMGAYTSGFRAQITVVQSFVNAVQSP